METTYTPATLAELTARKYPERQPIRLLDPLTARQRATGTATTGHADGQPGLRGHSIDAATYPIRVVGYGDDSWAVEAPSGETLARYYGPDACRRAHEGAKREKRIRYE